MANITNEEVLQTRIGLKYDSYEKWTTAPGKDLVLKRGEVGFCAIGETAATGSGEATTAPTVLFKVGNGTAKFSELKWVSGLAADVYAWAKATEAEHIAWLKTNHADLDTRYSFSTSGDKLVVKKTLYTNGVAGTEEDVGEYEFLTEGEVRTILEGYYTKEEVDALIEGVEAKIPTELGVMSVALESGTNNGTVKLTVNGTATDNIAVTGLQDAAYATVDSLNATAKGYADAVAEDLAEYQEAHKDDYTNAKIDEIVGAVEDKVDAIHVPVYSVTKDTAPGAYSAVYHLTRDGEIVGEAINIPKDMVVQEGSVVENPAGQPEGTYIKLVLQNVTDPLYINVGDLIEYVTSGSTADDQIIVNVSDDHKVTATIGAGKVGTTELADDAVTAGKLADAINEDIAKGVTAHGWGDHAQAGYLKSGDIANKADKAVPAAAGNFAALDANGNLIDSQAKAGDFATAAQGTKADTAVQNLVSGTGIEISETSTANEYTVALNATSIASLAKADSAVQPAALDAYVLKNDAPGYADILTKTDAQGIYETKADLSNDVKPIVKEVIQTILYIDCGTASEVI